MERHAKKDWDLRRKIVLLFKRFSQPNLELRFVGSMLPKRERVFLKTK